jgi:hypothetical protein
MYFGLMLSDFGFATDKWYWQTLIYLLSIVLTILEIFLTIVFPVAYVLGEECKADSESLNFFQILLRILFFSLVLGSLAFSFYTL